MIDWMNGWQDEWMDGLGKEGLINGRMDGWRERHVSMTQCSSIWMTKRTGSNSQEFSNSFILTCPSNGATLVSSASGRRDSKCSPKMYWYPTTPRGWALIKKQKVKIYEVNLTIAICSSSSLSRILRKLTSSGILKTSHYEQNKRIIKKCPVFKLKSF